MLTARDEICPAGKPINWKARLFGLRLDAFDHGSDSWPRDHHSDPGVVEHETLPAGRLLRGERFFLRDRVDIFEESEESAEIDPL